MTARKEFLKAVKELNEVTSMKDIRKVTQGRAGRANPEAGVLSTKTAVKPSQPDTREFRYWRVQYEVQPTRRVTVDYRFALSDKEYLERSCSVTLAGKITKKEQTRRIVKNQFQDKLKTQKSYRDMRKDANLWYFLGGDAVLFAKAVEQAKEFMTSPIWLGLEDNSRPVREMIQEMNRLYETM